MFNEYKRAHRYGARYIICQSSECVIQKAHVDTLMCLSQAFLNVSRCQMERQVTNAMSYPGDFSHYRIISSSALIAGLALSGLLEG